MKVEGDNNGSVGRVPRGSRIHWVRPDNTNGKSACGMSISLFQPPLDDSVPCLVCQAALNVRLRRGKKGGRRRIESRRHGLLLELGKRPDNVLALEFGCHPATIAAARKRHGIPAMPRKEGSRVHRGRPKEGKKQLALHLTPEELSDLRELAEENCRSASGQAVWIIRKAIKETPR